MSENEHRKKVEKRDAHKPPGTGCVTRCQGGKYVENNAHSHRWNAAEQARAETAVYTIPLNNNASIPSWRKPALVRLHQEGGLVGRLRKNAGNKLKPFFRQWWPFPHNAHHIIPMSVLWQNIDVAVAKAKKDPGKMFDCVIDGMLTEPYNHNDRPNMITLPTANRESKALGLPQHLEDKALDHPSYSDVVAAQVRAKLPPKYGPLATAVDKAEHPDTPEYVKVKSTLVPIAEATYRAIIALAKEKKLAGKTLDESAQEISALAATLGPQA